MEPADQDGGFNIQAAPCSKGLGQVPTSGHYIVAIYCMASPCRGDPSALCVLPESLKLHGEPEACCTSDHGSLNNVNLYNIHRCPADYTNKQRIYCVMMLSLQPCNAAITAFFPEISGNRSYLKLPQQSQLGLSASLKSCST